MNNAWRATLHLSLFYFIFGFQLPYLPVWLEEARQLNGPQISFVLFGALLARIIVGPLISAWADARTAKIASLILALLAWTGYLALNFTHQPILLAIVGFFLMSVIHAIIPLGEASLLLVADVRKPSFGQGRAIASGLFVIGVFLGGALIDTIGIGSLVPIITALLLGLIVTGYFMPAIPLGKDNAPMGFYQRIVRGFRLYKRPTLYLLMISTACVQAAHGFYYGFSSVIWEKQGFSGSVISYLWVTGVVLEIAFLALAVKLPNWVTPQRLVLVGALGSIIRWSIYGFVPDLVSTFILQNLHALTFAATYLGGVRVIHRDIAKEDQTLAFTLLAAVTGAITGVAGISSGFLYEQIGAQGYWYMAGLSLIGAIFACLMMLRISTRLE